MSIGSTKIKQLCFCTNDMERSEKCWTRILGIEPHTFKLDCSKENPHFTDGQVDTFGEIEFVVYQLGDMVLELVSPSEEDTPWRRYLEKHGEGLMNIAFHVPDRKQAYDEIDAVCEAGLPYHEGYFKNETYSLVDTSKELHVELNIKAFEDNVSLLEKLTKDSSNYKGYAEE